MEVVTSWNIGLDQSPRVAVMLITWIDSVHIIFAGSPVFDIYAHICRFERLIIICEIQFISTLTLRNLFRLFRIFLIGAPHASIEGSE